MSNCKVNNLSSRACERGTKGCEVRHTNKLTPEENALMAKLDSWVVLDKVDPDTYSRLESEGAKVRYSWCSAPDYDDERNLMPLAWKHGVDCDQELNGTWSAKAYLNKDNPRHGVLDITDANPKKAIQQALLAIARDKFK